MGSKFSPQPKWNPLNLIDVASTVGTNISPSCNLYYIYGGLLSIGPSLVIGVSNCGSIESESMSREHWRFWSARVLPLSPMQSFLGSMRERSYKVCLIGCFKEPSNSYTFNEAFF